MRRVNALSQSLLRQRLLPDSIESANQAATGALSQSLLRQRLLPDMRNTPLKRHLSTMSQSLLRQRLLPDAFHPRDRVGFPVSQSLLRQRLLPDLMETFPPTNAFDRLNRFFVSDYFRTRWWRRRSDVRLTVSIASSSAITSGHWSLARARSRNQSVSIASSSAITSGLDKVITDKVVKDAVSIASSSAITSGLLGYRNRAVASGMSQSLLRQRLLPDEVKVSPAQASVETSQSLLRQRLLPDAT